MDTRLYYLCALVTVLLGCCGSASGHGYLIEPPARSSLWRVNSSALKNYDDNGLNCGGLDALHILNNGRCGICGDNYALPTPRPNEYGGKYGQGFITRSYHEGDQIDIKIVVTANHRGHFQFSLCPLIEEPSGPVEVEECFENITLPGGERYYDLTSSNTGLYAMKVQLPLGVTCDKCVLRWHWRGGNNWGICPDGRGAVGCGPQEEFINCADISIV